MSRDRTSLRVSWATPCLGFLLLASTALAQASGPLFPPSIVITNYDRVLIGEEEALEAGAFVARVGSTTSGWYNPAGMMLVGKTAIGASGTGYETDALSLEGVQKQGGGMSIYQLPSFFGAILGEDVLHSQVWRFGFSIAKPVSWAQGVQAGASTNERVSYSSDVSFSTLMPMISVAFAPVSCLRIGVGVGFAITSLSEVQTLSAQDVTASTANAYLRTLDASGSIWNLTGNLGVQWDITPNLVLGAVMRLPGIKLISSGRLTYQNVDNNGTPWSQVFFKDGEATFDYKVPLDVNVGLGWHSAVFGVEADLRYHTAISDYLLFSSPNLVQVTTTASNGTPLVTTHPFPGVQNGTKQVWNWAVGGRVNVNESWSLHAGFFSDYSPTNATGQAIFRAINMYGFTVGAKVQGEHLSGSFGFGFNWGSSQTFNFGDSATGGTISTKLNITSLQFLYALTYSF